MNTDDRQLEILRFLQPNQPDDTPPLPPGVERGTLKPEAEAQLSDLYVKSLLERDPGSLTPEERNILRRAINRTLRQM